MKVYKYWAKDSALVSTPYKEWNLVCFGSSNESIEDAADNARSRIETIKSALLMNRPVDSYMYSDRPLREEVKREIHQNGDLVAVITRNTYGALVLNTTNVMFIDVDVVEDRKRGPGLLARLFGRKHKVEQDAVDVWQVKMDGMRESAERNGIGMRVYRTPKGYRCLVMNRNFEPTSEETQTLLEDFGSDELYVKLCRVQDCFRARLTPKPYRIKMPNPPSRYPWAGHGRMQAYRDWERHYEGKIVNYSACTFLEHYGDLSVTEDIGEIVGIHDALACTGKPIA